MSENTIIFPANLPEVQFLGKSQQKKDPSKNTSFVSGQNRRRRLFGATPVHHDVSWVFTAEQAMVFESFFENDLEGGSKKFLMQIDSVNGKDYQLFQFEEVYTGPDKIAGDAYTVSAKLVQFTFDKEYIEVRLPFTEVRSTDHTVSVVRNIGPDGAPDFDLSVGGSAGIKIARYNVTTYREIAAALADDKLVILKHSIGGSGFIAVMNRITSAEIEFRSVNSVGEVTTYSVNQYDVWKTSFLPEATIEHILDLSTLDEENSTFDVVLTANRNNAISFVGSSEETATVSIEIEDNKPYHIQIVGACTLAITGVEWWSDAITDIANKAEINILNNVAVGVLYE